MSSLLQNAVNYLVPSTGSPNIYSIHETFSATPFAVDFTQIGLNGLPFRPSGVIIDNTQGTGDLSILIPQVSYNIVCKAGASLAMQYPAPVNHSASITGLGDATVIFVDFPIMPFSSTQAAGTNIPNPLPVSGPLTDTELRASSVPVTGPLTDTELVAHLINDTSNVSSLPVIIRQGNLNATLTAITVTNAGTVGAGRSSITFINSGTTGVLVSGQSLPAGQKLELNAPAYADLPPVTYDATGGTLIIYEVVF